MSIQERRTDLRLLDYRPRYHIAPPFGSANDVQAVWRDGTYHVFYGYDRRFPPTFGRKCWGHVASRDLVQWQQLPYCMDPTPGSCDADGCWTGCLVDNDGVPTAFYTGVKPQVQCMATSRDMIHWDKHPANPVIPGPPEALERLPGFTNFRDPCVWREKDAWFMALGSGIPGKGSAVLLYRSTTLTEWEYMHPLFVGPTYDTDMYECPDFFALGDRHVLLVSSRVDGVGRTLYFVGRYRDHRFEPELEGSCDYGPNFYAAKTLQDGKGRRILWGWSSEAWSRDMACLAGWAGAYTVPRVLSLDRDGDLRFLPAPELDAACDRAAALGRRALAAGETWYPEGAGGRELDIEMSLDLNGAEKVDVLVLATPPDSQPEECTRITYDAGTAALCLDRSASSEFRDDNVSKGMHSGPLNLGPGEPLRLRVLVDRSMVEVFGNDRCCLTGRVYPMLRAADRVAFGAEGGGARIESAAIRKVGEHAGVKA